MKSLVKNTKYGRFMKKKSSLINFSRTFLYTTMQFKSSKHKKGFTFFTALQEMTWNFHDKQIDSFVKARTSRTQLVESTRKSVVIERKVSHTD